MNASHFIRALRSTTSLELLRNKPLLTGALFLEDTNSTETLQAEWFTVWIL